MLQGVQDALPLVVVNFDANDKFVWFDGTAEKATQLVGKEVKAQNAEGVWETVAVVDLGNAVLPIDPTDPTENVIVVTAAGATGTAGVADIFYVDAVAALADAAGDNYQPSITGFEVGIDTLRLKLAAPAPEVTNLVQLDALTDVAVQDDPFVPSAAIDLGNDLNGGELVVVNLVGLTPADWTATAVEVV